MGKSFALIFAAALFATPALAADRVVYKDVPAGRGQTQRLPFIVKDEHRAASSYALTGQRTTRIEHRDVPAGRGQTQRLPFAVTR